MAFYSSVERIGNNLCIRSILGAGKRKDVRLKYEPSLFHTDVLGETDWKNLSDQPLAEMRFDNMWDCDQYIKNNQSKALFGTRNYASQFIAEYYKGDIAWDINLMRVILMDIETESYDGIATPENPYGEILSISAHDSTDGKIHFWHRKPFENKHDDVVCHFCNTEKDLLKSFILFWVNKGNYPDIVSHWNGSRYDIPYIVMRIRKVFGDSAERVLKSMSPFGKYKQVKVRKKKSAKVDIGFEFSGISNLDYMDMYMKFNPKEQESFSLDYICKLEIEEGKIEFDGSFTELYENNPQEFFEYSIHDTRLLVKLNKALRNIELACQIAFLTKSPQINMSLGTVAIWEVFIYNALYDKHIQPRIKSSKSGSKDEEYSGAYVKEPVPGKYKWILSFDAASLYPSVARTFNTSIETHVKPDSELNEIVPKDFSWKDMLEGKLDFSEELRKRNLCISANRQFYRTDKEGILPELFGRCLVERKKFKSEMLKKQQEIETTKDESKKHELQTEATRLDVVQSSYKVLANSLYGAVGNQHFQYYKVENAEAITKGGHAVITITEEVTNKWLNDYCGTSGKDFVVGIDTDSVLVSMESVVEKDCRGMSDGEITTYLDKIGKEINAAIKERFDDFAKRWNCPKNQIAFKREKIASVAFWTGKKRYAMFVIDNEGVRYAEPKLKITGLDCVRSSTPPFYRKKIFEGVEKILMGSNDEMNAYIASVKIAGMKLKPEDVSFPRGVSDMDKYVLPNSRLRDDVSIPIGVRAAHQFNTLCHKYEHKSEEPIKSGDKFRFCYLNMPNPSHENVVGFRDKLPTVFGLDKYVARGEQFEKAFLSPILKMMTSVGWVYRTTAAPF